MLPSHPIVLPFKSRPWTFPDFERRFLAEASDGVLYADQSGVIRFWNGGCQRIFGFTSQEVGTS
jgi:PAS domain-containing protein